MQSAQNFPFAGTRQSFQKTEIQKKQGSGCFVAANRFCCLWISAFWLAFPAARSPARAAGDRYHTSVPGFSGP